MDRAKDPRGRKPKPPPPIVPPSTQQARERASPKLREIQRLISEYFGGMRAFMREWTINDEVKVERDNFMKGMGCKETIEGWLDRTEQDPKDAICRKFDGYIQAEISCLLKDSNSPIRYVKKIAGQTSIAEGITTGLEDMEKYVWSAAPVL